MTIIASQSGYDVKVCTKFSMDQGIIIYAIFFQVTKCHPLGSFEQMEAIHVAATPAELYNAVLVDTPLGRLDHFDLYIFLFYKRSTRPKYRKNQQ